MLELGPPEWTEVWTYRHVPFFVHGKRLCGIVDQVSNLLYVATLFWHVFWVPVLPLSSWIVVIDKHGFRIPASVQIGLRARSILMAWSRLLFILVGIVSGLLGLGGVISILAGGEPPALPALLLTVCFAAFMCIRALRVAQRASHRSAQDLALRAGFPEEFARELADHTETEPCSASVPDSLTVPCPRCSRPLAKSSHVCPRCEWHRDG